MISICIKTERELIPRLGNNFATMGSRADSIYWNSHMSKYLGTTVKAKIGYNNTAFIVEKGLSWQFHKEWYTLAPTTTPEGDVISWL